jgi:hypothetical protein
MKRIISKDLDTSNVDRLIIGAAVPYKEFELAFNQVVHNNHFAIYARLAWRDAKVDNLAFDGCLRLDKADSSKGEIGDYTVSCYKGWNSEVVCKIPLYSVPYMTLDGRYELKLIADKRSYLSDCCIVGKKIDVDEIVGICAELRGYVCAAMLNVFDAVVGTVVRLQLTHKALSYGILASNNKIDITVYESGLILFKATIRNN